MFDSQHTMNACRPPLLLVVALLLCTRLVVSDDEIPPIEGPDSVIYKPFFTSAKPCEIKKITLQSSNTVVVNGVEYNIIPYNQHSPPQSFSIPNNWVISTYNLSSLAALRIYKSRRDKAPDYVLMKSPEPDKYMWHTYKSSMLGKVTSVSVGNQTVDCLIFHNNTAVLVNSVSKPPPPSSNSLCFSSIIREISVYPIHFEDVVPVYPSRYHVNVRYPAIISTDHKSYATAHFGTSSYVTLTSDSISAYITVYLDATNIATDSQKLYGKSFSGLFDELRSLGFNTDPNSESVTQVYFTHGEYYQNYQRTTSMPSSTSSQPQLDQFLEEYLRARTFRSNPVPRVSSARQILNLLDSGAASTRKKAFQMFVYVLSVCPTFDPAAVEELNQRSDLIVMYYPRYPVDPAWLACAEALRAVTRIKILHPETPTGSWVVNPFSIMRPSYVRDLYNNPSVHVSDPEFVEIINYDKQPLVLISTYHILIPPNTIYFNTSIHFVGHGKTLLEVSVRPPPKIYNTFYKTFVNRTVELLLPIYHPSPYLVTIHSNTPIDERLGTLIDESCNPVTINRAIPAKKLYYKPFSNQFGSESFIFTPSDGCATGNGATLTVCISKPNVIVRDIHVKLNVPTQKSVLINFDNSTSYPIVNSNCTQHLPCFSLMVTRNLSNSKVGTLHQYTAPYDVLHSGDIVKEPLLLFKFGDVLADSTNFAYVILVHGVVMYKGTVYIKVRYVGNTQPVLHLSTPIIYSMKNDKQSQTRTVILGYCDEDARYLDQTVTLSLTKVIMGTQQLKYKDPTHGVNRPNIEITGNINPLVVITLKQGNPCTEFLFEWVGHDVEDEAGEVNATLTFNTRTGNGRTAQQTVILEQTLEYKLIVASFQPNIQCIDNASKIELTYSFELYASHVNDYSIKIETLPAHGSVLLSGMTNNITAVGMYSGNVFRYERKYLGHRLFGIVYTPPASRPEGNQNITLSFFVQLNTTSSTDAQAPQQYQSDPINVVFYYESPAIPKSSNYTIFAVSNTTTNFHIHTDYPYNDSVLHVLNPEDLTNTLEETNLYRSGNISENKNIKNWDASSKSFALSYMPLWPINVPLPVETLKFKVCRQENCSDMYQITFLISHEKVDPLSKDLQIEAFFGEPIEIKFAITNANLLVASDVVRIRVMNLGLQRNGALYFDAELTHKVKEDDYINDDFVLYYMSVPTAELVYDDDEPYVDTFNYFVEPFYQKTHTYTCTIKMRFRKFTPHYTGPVSISSQVDSNVMMTLSEHTAIDQEDSCNYEITNFDNTIEIIPCTDFNSCGTPLSREQLPYLLGGTLGRFIIKPVSLELDSYAQIHFNLIPDSSKTKLAYSLNFTLQAQRNVPSIRPLVEQDGQNPIKLTYDRSEKYVEFEWIVDGNQMPPSSLTTYVEIDPFVSNDWTFQLFESATLSEGAEEDDRIRDGGSFVSTFNRSSYLDSYMLSVGYDRLEGNGCSSDDQNMDVTTDSVPCDAIFRMRFMPEAFAYGRPYIAVTLRAYNGLHHSSDTLRYVISVMPTESPFNIWSPLSVSNKWGSTEVLPFHDLIHGLIYLLPSNNPDEYLAHKYLEIELLLATDNAVGALVLPKEAVCTNLTHDDGHLWKCADSLENINRWIQLLSYRSNSSVATKLILRACKVLAYDQASPEYCMSSSTTMNIDLSRAVPIDTSIRYLTYTSIGLAAILAICLTVLVVRRWRVRKEKKSGLSPDEEEAVSNLFQTVRPNPLYKSPNPMYTSIIYIPPTLSGRI